MNLTPHEADALFAFVALLTDAHGGALHADNSITFQFTSAEVAAEAWERMWRAFGIVQIKDEESELGE